MISSIGIYYSDVDNFSRFPPRFIFDLDTTSSPLPPSIAEFYLEASEWKSIPSGTVLSVKESKSPTSESVHSFIAWNKISNRFPAAEITPFAVAGTNL
jgi:hypothetical protein